MIHTKTFGPDGSFPRAVCGHRGDGPGARMRFCRADLLARHDDACPDCVRLTTTGQLALEVGS